MATYSELQKAVDALSNREPGWKKFTRPPPQGNKPAVVGKGVPGGSSAAGSGVRLSEKDYALREFYPPTPASSFTTSDGIFTFEFPALKRIVLENDVPFDFKPPV